MAVGRRTIGAIIGGAGSLVCGASSLVRWYADDPPRVLSSTQLVRAGEADEAAGFWTSMAAPLVIVAVLGLLGALMRSRLLVGLAWMGGVATAALWGLMRLIGVVVGAGPADLDIGFGVWLCVVGLLAMLVGVVVMGPPREEVEAPLSMFDDDE